MFEALHCYESKILFICMEPDAFFPQILVFLFWYKSSFSDSSFSFLFGGRAAESVKYIGLVKRFVRVFP